MTEDVADLQAQIVALRVAVEGAWLSLLSTAANPVAEAERIRGEHVAALGQLDAKTDAARAIQQAVIRHTEQLWGSIAWQVGEAKKP